ncbi:MAG: hypothetical protein KDD66_00960 [Bdellovibrionales bacterium]|nr:hypothetical protein [Bdellovibrionales bacterium]
MNAKFINLFLLFAVLAPAHGAAADDQIDVKGGFFGSNSVNQDFFGNSRRTPDNSKAKSQDDTKIRSTADSFRVGNPGEANAASVQKPEPSQSEGKSDFAVSEDSRFRGNNRVIVNQAADAIKKLKDLQTGGSSGLDDSILKSGEFYKSAVVSQPTPGTVIPSKPTPMLNESVTAVTAQPDALGAKLIPKDESAPVKLTLVVSAFPESHLRKQLALLRRVHVEQKVPIGDVVIAGGYKSFLVDQRQIVEEYAEMAEKEAKHRRSYPRSSNDIERMISRGDSGGMIAAANVEFSSSIERKANEISDEDAIEVLKNASSSELRKAKWTTLSRKSLQFAKSINNMTRAERERLTALAAEKYGKPEDLPNFAPDSYSGLARMGLFPSSTASMSPFLKTLNVSTSPVWLISVGNTTHVFEGEYDPRQLFSVDGKFIGPRS